MNRIKQAIAKIRRNKDGRILASNFGYLMLLQVGNYLVPLITIPYLAKTLGVDGFGKVAFAAAVIMWFQTVTEWGFNFTATRDVAKNRGDLDKVSEIYTGVVWSKIVLMLASFVFLLLLVIFVPYINENKKIIFLTFLLVPSSVFMQDWVFQAMEEMKYITILNFIAKLIFVVLVFVFIRNKSDYIYHPVFLSIGSVLCGIFSMVFLSKRRGVKLGSPSLRQIRWMIKRSADVFISNMVPNLYNSFSSVLLGFFGGSSVNGIYDAGSKLVGIGSQLLHVLSRVFFPFLSRRIDGHNLFAVLNIGLAVLMSVSLFLLSPWLIGLFFTPEFYQAEQVLKILSFSLIFISFSNVYGVNYLVLTGCEALLRNITFVSSVFGFLLSFPLVFYFGFIGAALTVFISRAMIGLGLMIAAKRIKKIA